MSKVFKTNMFLIDFGNCAFSPVITTVSITEENFREIEQKAKKAKEAGIKTFEIEQPVFELSEIKKFVSDEDIEESLLDANEFDVETFMPHDVYIGRPCWNFNSGFFVAQVPFKHTDGEFESFGGISLEDLQAFFGKKKQGKKFILIKIKERNGNYEYTHLRLEAVEEGNDVKTFVKKYLRNFYSDSTKVDADTFEHDVIEYWLSSFTEITEEEYLFLKKVI